MFLPINQYYAYAPPQKSIKIQHKKIHKLQSSSEIETERHDENLIQIAPTTTDAPFDELHSSSLPSIMSRSLENSNNNRI